MAQQRVEWVEYRISTSFTTHVDWSMTKTNTMKKTKTFREHQDKDI